MKVYIKENFIVFEYSDKPDEWYPAKSADFEETSKGINIFITGDTTQITLSSIQAGEVTDEQDTPYTLSSLKEFLFSNIGFSKAGDSSAITTTYFGFMDYNQ